MTVRLTVGALQERIDNRLIEAGRVTSDALVAIEEQQLTQLRSMVFTQGVAKALVEQDRQALTRLLRPQWTNAQLATLIAFDRSGQPLLAWEQAANANAAQPPIERQISNLPDWWLVQQIIAGRSDAFGDKFSAFHEQQLYTAAPVVQDGQVVGGLIVGLPLDQLLNRLQASSQASFTTFYNAQGEAIVTTHLVTAGESTPPIPAPILEQLRAEQPSLEQHIQSNITLSRREYQIAYSPLQLRRATTGFFAVGLSRQFIIDTWADTRLPLLGLFLALVGAVIAVGVAVSRRITQPLHNLVSTALAVSNGKLQRRASVNSHDELGVVAHSFNQMTERLLHLYETSRSLSTAIDIGDILTRTNAAIQPFVPGALTLALLRDQHGWRVHASHEPQATLINLDQLLIDDRPAITTLIAAAAEPLVAPVDSQPIPGIAIPQPFAEICYTALAFQEHTIGLLIYVHDRPGTFDESARMPLAAIASMTATALNNALLYTEIREEGEQRRVILESIADGVIVCDAERMVTLMNPAAEALLNLHDWQEQRYSFAQLPLTPLPASGASLAARPHQERYVAHGRVLRVTSTSLATTGEGGSGEVIVLHDISDEVALDQAKTNLIAMISHELRTPLTAIQGSVDLLRTGIGGQLSPIQAQLVDTASRQTRAMTGLIDKAIIVANIETNTLTLDIQPTELAKALDSTIRALQATAQSANTELQIELASDLPQVLVDARMLQIALEEVVDNAIKYGGGTPVQISAYTLDDDVVVAIRDHGPGISPEDQQHLFSSLSRGADTLNAEPRGLGLGLVITRELLERQGCAISVQSELGQGSVFSILLPGAGRDIPVPAVVAP
ncbi:MAG TPA: ATP-binding protein [Herpetosiphonaceae bacterium]